MPGLTAKVRLLTATFSPYRLVSPSSSIMPTTLGARSHECHSDGQTETDEHGKERETRGPDDGARETAMAERGQEIRDAEEAAELPHAREGGGQGLSAIGNKPTRTTGRGPEGSVSGPAARDSALPRFRSRQRPAPSGETVRASGTRY